MGVYYSATPPVVKRMGVTCSTLGYIPGYLGQEGEYERMMRAQHDIPENCKPEVIDTPFGKEFRFDWFMVITD